MSNHMVLVSVLVFLSILHPTCAQAPVPEGRDKGSLLPIQPRSSLFERRRCFSCRRFYREPDGTCTNNRDKETRLWGSTRRAQNSYNQRQGNSIPIGKGLRSPRDISNILSAQHTDIFDERGLSEMATFFGQFIDHTLAATPASEESFDIPLKPEDSVARDRASMFGNASALPFKRSIRVEAERRDFVERPMNSLSSAMDLANVYGANAARTNHLKASSGGKMRVSNDLRNLLPSNTRNFNNAPDTTDNFFLAGDHRANEHPVLTALHTVFLREHNLIADEVTSFFKSSSFDKDDDEIFDIARKINEAQFQRIVFEEWFPAISGRSMPRERGFQPDVDLTLTTEFTTAAFRFGHTMVGNEVKRKGEGNVNLPSRSLLEMFFQVVDVIQREGIEPFLRGALTSRAQKVDLLVVDALRNSLFAGVKNEKQNFDLIALNIQRGRDHAISNYNALRRRFCCPKAVHFSDITSDRNVQSRLQTAYTSAGRVEAWPGMMAEDHAPGSSLGPTLLGLLRSELARIRNGDRFYFRNMREWPREVFDIPRVKRLVRSRPKQKNFDVFREVLLRNTNIKPEELPEKLFFV